VAHSSLAIVLPALFLALAVAAPATPARIVERGTSLPAMSRLLRAFEDNGRVDLARERILIRDRAALAAVAAV